ncbi:MAG: hypothetical protein RLZZ152_950 [Pseudomonadota bacterium]|jgi:hypothetical protein
MTPTLIPNCSQVGHIGQFCAFGGVVDVKSVAAFDPLAVDQGVGFDE